jgi:hypothetical protein
MSSRIIFFFFLIIISTTSFCQRKENQISLRVGEPMGVGYKRFFTGGNAIEFLVGTATKQASESYYRDSFQHYIEGDVFEYKGHEVENILYLQARYLFQRSIPWEAVPGSFEWYWGAGVLYKQADLIYIFNVDTFDDLKATFRDIDVGPEAILGLDYSFKEIPLTIYSELDVLVEVTDRPGSFRGFMVVGLRYNF